MASQGPLEAESAVDRRHETVAPVPAILGMPVPDRLWRYRWAFAAAVWTVAVVAIYLTPLGGYMNPYLSLTGVLVGFLVGLTGMGGGALMTPILIFFFGFTPTLAIGTDITYAAVTKAFGSWRHFRQSTVDWPLALWLALGSIPAGILGAFAVDFMKRNYTHLVDLVLYRAIGTALILVGVLLIWRVLILKIDKSYPLENIHLSLSRKLATVGVGVAAGFIIGLTSVGSGTLLAMVLILFYPLATSRVVGTDVFHSLLLLSATGIAQIRFGNVDLGMVAALLLGSVPGVILGSHLTLKTPAKWLRFILALVLLASGVAMLLKA